MNYNHESLKWLITGPSGTGKTTLWEKLVRKQRARLKFVYDHQGEFAPRFGVPAVTTVDGLVEKTALGGWVVFDPVRLFPGHFAQGFAFFCDYVLEVSSAIGGRKLFACDEVQKLTDTRNEPNEFLALCEVGRRLEIDVLAISQAPNRIHNSIRNQLTRVYTFRQLDENALKFLSENGFDETSVRNLPRFDYVWRDLKSGETGAS